MEDKAMLVGWSTADITPDRPVVLRGQFHTRISDRVNDPLTATALAMEADDGTGGKEQALMVSCDLVSVPGVIHERLREALRPRLPDFDVSKLFLNATHTHTGPTITAGCYPEPCGGVMTATEYADLFVERVADAATQAWQGRAAGGVSWAYGHAVVGHNRRASYLDGHSQMYGQTDGADFCCLEGYEDHGVDLLFAWDERGGRRRSPRAPASCRRTSGTRRASSCGSALARGCSCCPSAAPPAISPRTSSSTSARSCGCWSCAG
jgi:hypothetical protein